MKIDGKEQIRIHVGGKFSFAKLQPQMQKAIRERIIEKNKALNGKISQIKINGKVVTAENVKEFEKKSTKEISKKYIKEDLEKLSFKDLREIGYKLGTKDRSKKNLIKEILNLQKNGN